MRPRMADVEGQRRLIEVAALDLDAGGLAAQRLPPVGADHQARGQRFSLAGANDDIGVIRADRVGLIVEPRQIGKLGRALLQRRHQRAVLDVVAERVEADFVARKPDLGRADQAAGIVDQPHRLQCRRLVLAARPDIQLPQEIDGAAEQGGGAVIGIGRAAGDQGGFGAGLRQRNRRRKSGRAAADHDDVVCA